MQNVFLSSCETHEDIIILNPEIARGLESGELEMPAYGVIVKTEKEES